jgi:hypothetical protein
MTTWEEEASSRPLMISHLLGLMDRPAYLRVKPDTSASDPPGCLYCMRTAGPFNSVEHIIPEGLGNEHLILPRGVTCDPCNNGPLSVLDNEILDFMPVAMMRTVRGVPTKAGRPPRARFGNASLTRIGPAEVLFETNSRKAAKKIPGGMEWHVEGRRMTEAYTTQLVRWLFKAALACTFIDRGRPVALSPQFDEIRHIILGSCFHGYLALRRKGDPDEQVQFTHWPISVAGQPTVFTNVDVFGVSLAADLLVRRADLFKFDPSEINVIEFDRHCHCPIHGWRWLGAPHLRNRAGRVLRHVHVADHPKGRRTGGASLLKRA